MTMTEYDIPSPEDPAAIGTRAKMIRDLVGLTVSQLAAQAGVSDHDVEALESGSSVSLAAALAIHRVLSGEGSAAALFARPKLRNIDEVEAFEKLRLRRQCSPGRAWVALGSL